MPSSSKKILAIIPARSGSLGIPGKNIKDFAGRPLIAHTIEAAQESGIFDRIVVSTDSEDIAAVARQYGAEVPYLRPPELATATASVADAVEHMLAHLREVEGYEPELFYLLQPTSPLRDAGDIVKSLACFEAQGAPALVSVVPTHHQTLTIEGGNIKVVNPEGTSHLNRQELPQTYKQDGSMIYVQNTKHFLSHKSFDAEGAAAYIVPKWKAVDIDDREDFELAEVLYKNKDAFEAV